MILNLMMLLLDSPHATQLNPHFSSISKIVASTFIVITLRVGPIFTLLIAQDPEMVYILDFEHLTINLNIILLIKQH